MNAAKTGSGKEKRDHWSNNFGFVMAAAGAAIGLGNIWRFPYVCGENGGGAFIIAYIACVFLIGMPVVWAELAIGRHSERGSGGAFMALVKKNKHIWHAVGVLGVLIAFIVTSYYTIIAGWTLEYLSQALQSIFNGGFGGDSQAYFNEFMASDSRQIFWHIAFTAITVVILLGGISGGIEKVTEVLMPILLFILIGLAIFAFNLEANMAVENGHVIPKSWEFFFKPDWSKFTGESFFHALGQAAFSLSIAVGTMVAYGSYLDKKENIVKLGAIVVCMDTMVALLSGLVIFPIVFAFGLNPEAGTGLVFVTLPALFAQMPGGEIIAPAFYILLFFAALTSSISLLEPVVTHFVDEYGKSRFKSCLFAGLASAVAGIIWILTNSLEKDTLLGNVDKFVSDLLIPLEAIAVCVFIGWFLEKRISRSEVKQASDTIYNAWIFVCKWVAPIGIAVILVRGL